MARIRTIKPDFWEDEGIGCLSMAARLLFIATWNMADDEGLLRWTPEILKAQAFPYDHDVTSALVESLMGELVAGNFVVPYVAGQSQQKLAYIVNFRKHQRINRPQPPKFPAPPDVNDSVNDSLSDSRNDSLPEGKGMEGNGKGMEGNGSDAAPEAPLGFDRFWPHYPRKIGKPGALKAWKKIPTSEHGHVLDGLGRWNHYWQATRTASEHIPHPSTWLNDRRWDGDIPTARASPRAPNDPIAEYRDRHGLELLEGT